MTKLAEERGLDSGGAELSVMVADGRSHRELAPWTAWVRPRPRAARVGDETVGTAQMLRTSTQWRRIIATRAIST